MDLDQIRDLVSSTPTKIVLLVMDGLGGLPHPDTGKTELETARIPNLNRLASRSTCGVTDPVLTGITPGSGPGHLSLFGYDPVKYLIKRGVIEALGVDIALRPGDISARGNFCTVDADGRITDRRAGRIVTAESEPLCDAMDKITVSGAQVRVYCVRDYRCVVVLRGEGLDDNVSESDPQRLGERPLTIRALSPAAEKTARIANEFIGKVGQVLKGQPKANMVLWRGFSSLPHIPQMHDVFKLKPAAIATYPMYRGLAKTLGMDVLPTGATFAEEIDTLAKHWTAYDYFYLHYKPTDAAGEDGDFDRKVRALEEVDALLPRILDLAPDVLMVGGDHSSPSVLKGHSWHPVPFLLHSRYCIPDSMGGFNERSCARGSLGRFPAQQAMVLALANALKLTKYGA